MITRRRVAITTVALGILAFLWWLARPSTDIDVALETPSEDTPERTVVRDAPTPPAGRADLPPVPKPEPTEPGAPRPLRGTTTTLSNGLTVLLVEDRTESALSTRIVVKVGSAHEGPGEYGLAHLVEHLMFLGTTDLGTTNWAAEQEWHDELRRLTALTPSPNVDRKIDDALAEADRWLLNSEYAEALDAIGAFKVNAYTSFDTTEYVAGVPPNAFLPWAVLEAERFADPVFRSFPRVQDVVALEQDGLASRHDRYARVFEGHPYGRSIAGTGDSIARLHLGAAEDFYARHYHPENMAIVVVGDLDTAEALAILEEQFGNWRPASRSRLPVDPVRETRVLYEPGGGRKQSTAMWGLPPISPMEEPALRVALSALAGRMTRPRDGWRLPSVSVARYAHGAVLQIQGYCGGIRPGDADAECRRVLTRSIAQLREKGVSKGQLAWLRKRAWYARLRELEDCDTQAAAIADAWAAGLDLDGQWALVDRLRWVTLEQIDAAIDKYLVAGPLLDRPPSDSKRQYHVRRLKKAPDRGERTSGLFDLVTSIERPPMPARWAERGEDFDTSEDGRVIVAYNPSNTLFEARLVYPVGWSDFPALRHGLAAWEQAERESGSVFRLLQPYGVRLQVEVAGPERTVLLVDGPRESIDAALVLIRQSLANPVLADRAYPSKPSRVLGWALHGPNDPWAPSIAEPTPSEMRAAVSELAPVAPRLLYSGTETPDGLARATEGARFERTPPLQFQHDGLRIGVAESDVYSQSKVQLFLPVPMLAPEDEALYTLLERTFTGRTGRVRKRMRDDSALSYFHSAEVRRPTSHGPGHMHMSAYVRHKRLEEGARSMLGLVDAPTVTLEQFDTMVEKASEEAWRNPVKFRKLPGVLAGAQDRGIDTDPARIVWERLQGLDVDTYQTFLDELTAGPRVLTLRGERIDRTPWEALAPVETMPSW